MGLTLRYIFEGIDKPKLCTFPFQLAGLMTIGAFDHDLAEGPNPDFQRLKVARAKVCQVLQMPENELELSMGMSNDVRSRVSTCLFIYSGALGLSVNRS